MSSSSVCVEQGLKEILQCVCTHHFRACFRFLLERRLKSQLINYNTEVTCWIKQHSQHHALSLNLHHVDVFNCASVKKACRNDQLFLKSHCMGVGVLFYLHRAYETRQNNAINATLCINATATYPSARAGRLIVIID